MNNEVWKKVNANTELRFNIQISDKGNLRKIDDNGNVYGYKTFINSRGYMNTLLHTLENGRKNFTIHRLLMLTFVGGGEGLVINHKDGDRLNNSLDNLEWVTRSQNCQHSKTINGYKRIKDFTDVEILLIINEYIETDINLNDLTEKHSLTRESMRTLINNRARLLVEPEVYKKIRNKHLSFREKTC